MNHNQAGGLTFTVSQAHQISEPPDIATPSTMQVSFAPSRASSRSRLWMVLDTPGVAAIAVHADGDVLAGGDLPQVIQELREGDKLSLYGRPTSPWDAAHRCRRTW